MLFRNLAAASYQINEETVLHISAGRFLSSKQVCRILRMNNVFNISELQKTEFEGIEHYSPCETLENLAKQVAEEMTYH
jgi:hypothetical protein